ncbi:hypothetical protein Cylst_6246 (plasmid) [Cylindrospermum stagnale PCC 7417]|uniref:Uncharacterized protein n=1 Tax=Cylindrospermum stagnale PCC 7417 TaxID=56107 RepID=K9X8T9_9NOST|nr:hypothetical protein Cylst_6246 [Cylindrospermum stagnale PCC 7417]
MFYHIAIEAKNSGKIALKAVFQAVYYSYTI